MRVQIHSQAEPPFVHELGFGVAPGFQTFVATQEQRVGVLPTLLHAEDVTSSLTLPVLVSITGLLLLVSLAGENTLPRRCGSLLWKSSSAQLRLIKQLLL